MTTLRELAAMLDKATSGTRDMDYAIQMALVPRNERTGDDIPYSVSIDATLGLVERLFPDRGIDLKHKDADATASNTWVFGIAVPGDFAIRRRAPTAALAILRALVAALVAKETTDEQA